jgi:hypothetical protein
MKKTVEGLVVYVETAEVSTKLLAARLEPVGEKTGWWLKPSTWVLFGSCMIGAFADSSEC